MKLQQNYLVNISLQSVQEYKGIFYIFSAKKLSMMTDFPPLLK